MANFIGRSGSFLLFTQDERGVVVDSEVNLIVASGSSEILSASQYWSDGYPTEESIVLAEAALISDDSPITASAKRLYTIPKGVQNEAKKALAWRKEEKRGGTDVGLNTARTLAKGGQIGIEKVRHIAKYFARHEVDKKGAGWTPGEAKFPSNGRIAWALWGGDAAWRWASAIVERENKEAITADAYGFVKNSPSYVTPDIQAFEKAYELDEEYAPEFLVRVRLDGSGMDRLYKIDHDGEVYLWDDGAWDDFGRVGNDIWGFDTDLDDTTDECEKSHVVIDPESAVMIAARLHADPYSNVHIEDIDYNESKMAAEALHDIDWEFIDQTITAAGTEADGVYTEEERSKNASAQLRDKSGHFAKMGGRVMVGGDPRGVGKITKLNAKTGQVTVALDNGRSIDVDSKMVEGIGDTTVTIPGKPVEIPRVDVSGILGEPRTPVDRGQATLPGTLPAFTSDDIHNIISNFPSWVSSQRASFKGLAQPSDVVVQGKDSSSTGGVAEELQRKTGGTLIRDANTHPLVSDWLKKSNKWTGTKNTLWYNPLTAAGESKDLTPETSDVQPLYMAVVDEDDPRAVLALVSLLPATSDSTTPMTYVRKEGKWVKDVQMISDLNSSTPPPVVPLDETVLNDVLKQVDKSQGVDAKEAEADASAPAEAPAEAKKTEEPVTAALVLSVLFGPSMVAAGGLDRNQGNAEDLRQYWTRGAGAAKIRWGKGGDWKRCVRLLGKYMGTRAKGYCQLRHKEALGYYTSTHAKMLKNARGASVEAFEDTDFTEVTELDMALTLDEIVNDTDETFDASWEPEEEIVNAMKKLGECTDEEFALVAAGGLDRNRGGAEKLRRYWTVGKGGAKIRWGTKGDWTRCVRNLSKYLGQRSKGYCALRHKEMNGMWPGDARNRQFAIHASGNAIYSDFFIRSEEEILDNIALSARMKHEAARFSMIASGMEVPVDAYFLKDAVERTPEMEEIVEMEAPVDEHDIKIVDLIPSQPTVDMDNVEEVMDSEKPVDVLITEDGPVLVDGHHRTVAHEERGEETVPAKIYKAVVASGEEEEEAGSRFHIPLVIPEEMESGDGRKFKKGAITMRDLPLPLMWQIKTSDGHAGSVVVGRIDSMERTPEGIGNAYGYFDTGEFGKEAERMVRNGFLRGVSADMDKFEAEESSPKDKKEDATDAKIKKEKVSINKARVMGVTIVPKPAFQECSISVVDNTDSVPEEETVIPDGIYVDEVDPREASAVVASAMIAGAIPTEPPADWFTDPQLTQPTPLTVDNMGRVFGHIAAWNVDHIGMVAGTKPPRSRSNYKYFHTGVCRTDAGTDIPVGQLTLAGGHADITASAAVAAKHYDDTASAIADVHAGEDAHGIWVAGALRPGTTPEQVRALRASAPSGDWRPIQGKLELVAVCQVNVPGFPIARAMVAGGQVTALVAAGAYALAKLRVDPMDELSDRLAKIEADQKAPLVAAAKAAKAKLAVIRAGGFGMEESEPILVEALENLLADVVTVYFRAHAYHWNVKGQDFAQYHELFEEIYSDIYSSIDPIAENIRKLGHDAPISLSELVGDASIEDADINTADAKTLAYDLYEANEALVLQLKALFSLADAVNEQGIADFVAGRIDAHQKWCWQLRASIVPEEMAFMETEHATPESMEEHYNMVFSQLEEQGLVASLYKTRKFTTAQREALAKKGQALPDGSFPIENAEDLQNAIKAFGRASLKKQQAVKAHIAKRAKALGKQELIPKGWPGYVKPKGKPEFSVVEADDLRARIASITASLDTKEQ